MYFCFELDCWFFQWYFLTPFWPKMKMGTKPISGHTVHLEDDIVARRLSDPPGLSSSWQKFLSFEEASEVLKVLCHFVSIWTEMMWSCQGRHQCRHFCSDLNTNCSVLWKKLTKSPQIKHQTRKVCNYYNINIRILQFHIFLSTIDPDAFFISSIKILNFKIHVNQKKCES